MAEFAVEVSRVQPQDQGIRVPAKHPMPPSRGSMFAAVPAPHPNERIKEPEQVRAGSVPEWLR
jgi:hypothetical protein